MNAVSNVTNFVSKTAGRSGLIVSKYSPEILLGVGIAGAVASTVMACKATLKAEYLLDTMNDSLNKVRDAKETFAEDQYSQADYQKDLALAYARGGISFAKLYGPAVTLGALSVGCILGSHGIIHKRNVALMAAYRIVEEGFADYRRHVVDELGEDKDRSFRYGSTKNEVVTEVETDGKMKTVKRKVDTFNPDEISIYARMFDQSSPQWQKTSEYNLMFLKAQQNNANDLLHARGHIFLNEVYDSLGIPRTQAGAVVGWVNDGDKSDSFVDFGFMNIDNERARDFVNGYENCVLLDFNVDGVVWDLI